MAINNNVFLVKGQFWEEVRKIHTLTPQQPADLEKIKSTYEAAKEAALKAGLDPETVLQQDILVQKKFVEITPPLAESSWTYWGYYVAPLVPRMPSWSSSPAEEPMIVISQPKPASPLNSMKEDVALAKQCRQQLEALPKEAKGIQDEMNQKISENPLLISGNIQAEYQQKIQALEQKTIHQLTALMEQIENKFREKLQQCGPEAKEAAKQLQTAFAQEKIGFQMLLASLRLAEPESLLGSMKEDVALAKECCELLVMIQTELKTEKDALQLEMNETVKANPFLDLKNVQSMVTQKIQELEQKSKKEIDQLISLMGKLEIQIDEKKSRCDQENKGQAEKFQAAFNQEKTQFQGLLGSSSLGSESCLILSGLKRFSKFTEQQLLTLVGKTRLLISFRENFAAAGLKPMAERGAALQGIIAAMPGDVKEILKALIVHLNKLKIETDSLDLAERFVPGLFDDTEALFDQGINFVSNQSCNQALAYLIDHPELIQK